MLELMRCRRCHAVPGEARRLRERSSTGLEFMETQCVACGWKYEWKVATVPRLEVLPTDERPLKRRARNKPDSFPGFDEQERAGAFRKPGDGRSPLPQ
jgi:RNase P subunit RPR2